MSEKSKWPSVTVGVVTYPGREAGLRKLLIHLVTAIERYPAAVSLCVGNNGGVASGRTVRALIASSAIADRIGWRVLDSPENNIAVGRNLVLDATEDTLVAFIDDDEYPRPDWLRQLVGAHREFGCPLVAGPILPVYAEGTPSWIRSIDLHNARGRSTGDRVRTVASGNFLADLDKLGEIRFCPHYGRNGTDDTELFLRLARGGHELRWTAEAIVDEDIPPNRCTASYTIRRAFTQGAHYRSLMRAHHNLGRSTEARFVLRSAWTSLCCGVIAVPLLIVGHRDAGQYVRRAFENLGKVRGEARSIYG